MTAWVASAEGLFLSVRVTPRGGRDRIDGVIRTADARAHLAVRVAAAPDKGDANEAVRRLIARAAGISPSDVTLSSGHAARVKRLHLRGDPATIADRLTQEAGRTNQ